MLAGTEPTMSQAIDVLEGRFRYTTKRAESETFMGSMLNIDRESILNLLTRMKHDLATGKIKLIVPDRWERIET